MPAAPLQIVSINHENATEFPIPNCKSARGTAMVLKIPVFAANISFVFSKFYRFSIRTNTANSNANAQVLRQAKTFTSLHFLSTFSDEIYYRATANDDWLLEKEKNSNRMLIICCVRMWE
jgi:hypothetical protein